MTNPSTEPLATPPYGPFATFKGFLATLKSTALPSVIDGSMLARQSGTAKTHLRTTLKFFGLTADDGAVTPRFRALVAAYGTDQWPAELSLATADAYGRVVQDIDLENGTLGQLINAFKTRGGVTGSVLRKAVRFYLTALDEAGGGYSPHFSQRALSTVAEGPRNAGRKKGAIPPKSATRSREIEEPDDLPDEGTERLTVPLPGRDPVRIDLPDDLSTAQWSFVDAFVRSYIKLREENGE